MTTTMTGRSHGGGAQSPVSPLDAAVGEAIRRVVASPTLGFAWRDGDGGSRPHASRAALVRRILGRLLLAAMPRPRGVADSRWRAMRETLADTACWPTVPGWQAAVHDAALDALAVRLPLPPAVPEAVGHIYERWLQAVPRWDAATGTVCLDPHSAQRKAAGCFYTPQPLAQQLAEATLAPWATADTALPRLVDPACGTGAFLLAALDVLCRSRAGGVTPREIAATCLHGVDCDAVALGLARVAVWHAAVSAPGGRVGVSQGEALARALLANLRVGDALLGPGFGSEPQAAGKAAVADADAEPEAAPVNWPTAFPHAAAAAGFDAVLGNPPWEKVKALAREFFAERRPAWRHLTRREFDTAVQAALPSDPALAAEWAAHQQRARSYAERLRAWYRLLGRGDGNLYKAFVERTFELVAPAGRIGLVLPYSFCIDLGAAELRRHAFAHHGPLAVTRYTNRDATFGIASVVNFVTLLAHGRGHNAAPPAAREVVRTRSGSAPELAVPLRLVRLVSPGSLSIPEVATAADVQRLQRLYEGAPLLGGRANAAADAAAPLAGVFRVAWRRELDMTLDRWRFNITGDGLPVYEGKMIHQYRVDWAGTAPRDAAHGRRDGKPVWVKEAPPLAANGLPFPRYWVRPCDLVRASVDEPAPSAAALREVELQSYRCAVRLIQNSRNRRVLIATLLPPGVVAGNSLATAVIKPQPACAATHLRQHLFLCGWLNDDELDWLIRLKIDANLNLFHLNQLPLPPAAARDTASGAVADPQAYAAVFAQYGVRALVRLLQQGPRVYAPLAEAVLAPEDAWSAAARDALAAAGIEAAAAAPNA